MCCNWFANHYPARHRQNGIHFANDILKCLFLNGNYFRLLSIENFCRGLKSKSPLVQVMVWRRTYGKPIPAPMSYDFVIMYRSHTFDAIQRKLQHTIHSLEKRTLKNGFTISKNKTLAMHFCPDKNDGSWFEIRQWSYPICKRSSISWFDLGYKAYLWTSH